MDMTMEIIDRAMDMVMDTEMDMDTVTVTVTDMDTVTVTDTVRAMLQQQILTVPFSCDSNDRHRDSKS